MSADGPGAPRRSGHPADEAAYERFLARWRKRCAAVAASLEDGGLELLTFYRFPKE